MPKKQNQTKQMKDKKTLKNSKYIFCALCARSQNTVKEPKIKVGFSPAKKNVFICFSESPLQTKKIFFSC